MKKAAIFVILAAAFVTAVPPMLGYWVYREVKARTHARIEAEFHPEFFSPAFRLENAVIEWDGKISLSSGTLNVQYDLSGIFRKLGIRVKVSGSDLPVQFTGALQELSSGRQIVVQDFYADVTINKDGLEEINMLRAKAPEMQFQFGLTQ